MTIGDLLELLGCREVVETAIQTGDRWSGRVIVLRECFAVGLRLVFDCVFDDRQR
jgi:hypothetical protein